MSPPRILRVAAVQVESRNGEVEANLARAETWVARAATEGARLVLCPEFLAAGYVYDTSIWASGEPRSGPTESWLQRLAAAHRIYLGASYLEADGNDFYNTFALAGPDGRIAGRVQKESLPAFEGWYFKSCPAPKVIETEIGRIAVGICQDNHTARFFRHLIRDEPDLVLMPHSAPCVPVGAGILRDALRQIPAHYARAFGVPVVLVNKVAGRSRSPVPGIPWLRLRFDFPGLSSICDGDGRLLDRAPHRREGIAVADVTLDPARKRRPEDPTSFYWSRAPHRFPRALGALFVLLEHLGKRAYAGSAARAGAARACRRDSFTTASAPASAPRAPDAPPPGS